MRDSPRANDCCAYAAKIIGCVAKECPLKTTKILLSKGKGFYYYVSIITNDFNLFYSEPDIAAALIETIAILCGLNSKKMIKGFIDAGVVKCLLNVLKTFDSDDSLLGVMLLTSCVQLLTKLGKTDDKVLDSIKQKGVVKNLALAMANHPESSELRTVCRNAIKLFVHEKDLSQSMDIIARSQTEADACVDRKVLQHAISVVSNMELNEANTEYIVSEKGGIPLFLSIISDQTSVSDDSIRLFSAIHALNRLLITPDAIATWESNDGIKIFESVINKASHSELTMIAVCDGIEHILRTLHGAAIIKNSDLLQLITKNVFKSNSAYTKCIAKYYDILINPKHEMLDKIGFVNALVESGLIEGINNHLQHNMNTTDEVILSIHFMAILVSKQPKFTSDIIKNCGQSVVHAVHSRRNNDARSHSLDDVVRKLVLNARDLIPLFSKYGSSDILKNILDDKDLQINILDDANTSRQGLRLMLTQQKIFVESPKRIPEYYDRLMDAEYQFLSDSAFVHALVKEDRLIDVIKHHLEHNKGRSYSHVSKQHKQMVSREPILSINFLTHLLQKQPKLTRDILDTIALTVVNLIDSHQKDPDVFHSLYEAIRTFIRNDPDSIEGFKHPKITKGLDEALNGIPKGVRQIMKEKNILLLLMEGQDEIMNSLRSISSDARKLKDKPNDIHLIRELEDQETRLKKVIADIHSASLIKPMQEHFVDLFAMRQGVELLVDSGIVQKALKYMDDNPRANDCCVYAAKMIGSVAKKCPLKTTNILLRDHGNGTGLATITKALCKLHSVPDISAALIETINILCGLNLELIRGVIDGGAVEGALGVLSTFNSKKSTIIQMLLITTVELLIRLAEFDGTVELSIKRNGAMENIALAMDNHSESDEFIIKGRKAIKLFVQEKDLPQAMRIIARSQSDPNSFGSKQLHDAIAIVGNLVLIGANAKYVVSHDGVRLFLRIIGGTIRDNKDVLASAIRALGRLFNTDNAVQIWEVNGGVNSFEDIISNESLSELVMNALADAIRNLLSADTRVRVMIKQETDLLPLLTSEVFKAHSGNTDYKTWIRKYYNVISEPQNQILDDAGLMQSLIEHGLMVGIRRHLKRNKNDSDEVVLSLTFIIHLLSKQPDLIKNTFSKQTKCARRIAKVIALHKDNANVTSLECDDLQDILDKALKAVAKPKRVRGITSDLITSSVKLKAAVRNAWDCAEGVCNDKYNINKLLRKLNQQLKLVKELCAKKNTSGCMYKTLKDGGGFPMLSSCFKALNKTVDCDAHKHVILSATSLLCDLSQSKHSTLIVDNLCYRQIADLYLSYAKHQDLANYLAQITHYILQNDPNTIQSLKEQCALKANRTIMHKFTNRKDRKDESFASLAKENIAELTAGVHSSKYEAENTDPFARTVKYITDALSNKCSHTGFNINEFIYIHGGACRDAVIKPDRHPNDLDLQVDLHELHQHAMKCTYPGCKLAKRHKRYRMEYYYTPLHKDKKKDSKELDSGYFKRYFTSLVIINARYLLLEILNKDAEFKKHCQKIEKPKKHGDTIFTYKFVFEDHVEDVDVEIDFMDVACYFSTNNDRAIRNLKVRNKPYYVITHPFSLQRADCTFNALYIALSDIAESSKNYILPYKEWGQVVKDPCREYKDKYGKFSALSDLKKGIVRRMYIEFATETRTDDLDPDQAQFLVFRTLKNAFKLFSTGDYDTIYIHEQLQNADTGNWFKPNQWEKDRKRDQKGDDKKKKKGGQLDAVVRHAFRHNYFKKMDDSFIAAVYHMLGYDSLFFFYYKDEEGTPCFRKAVRKARKNKSKYPRANTIWKCMTQNIKRRKAECGGDLDLMIKSKPTQCQASDCLFIQLKGDDIISDESHQ
eukprot:832297_1